MSVLMHQPVMLDQVIQALLIDSSGIYLDCTFGRGGHSLGILQNIGPTGKLLAIDKDADAVNSESANQLAGDSRFEIEWGSFAKLLESIDRRQWRGKLAGVLMDLGVSSPQLDFAERGFSFLRDGPLDMRMDTSNGISAAEWLNIVEENELTQVLRRFGEERYARRIARSIVAARGEQPILTTMRLAAIIEQAVPRKEPNKHSATRSFQAIRIFINKELSALQEGLAQAVECLRPAGRLVVIAFHSLEDRLVKRFIRDECRGGEFPPGLPVDASAFTPRLKTIGKMLRPSVREIDENPRARSAILRVAERLV